LKEIERYHSSSPVSKTRLLISSSTFPPSKGEVSRFAQADILLPSYSSYYSSTHPPLLPLPSTMLSSLPTELIREIIESAVPHSFHSKTYRERQRTLCSLSLVSKLLQSIAQPLLLEIAWIRSTSELDRLPIAGASRIGKEGRGVQYAVVESNPMDGSLLPSVGDATLQRALRLLQLVTTLTASGLYGVALDLCVFEDFSSTSCSPFIFRSKLIVKLSSDRPHSPSPLRARLEMLSDSRSSQD
jgi:hypothetical protein